MLLEDIALSFYFQDDAQAAQLTAAAQPLQDMYLRVLPPGLQLPPGKVACIAVGLYDQQWLQGYFKTGKLRYPAPGLFISSSKDMSAFFNSPYLQQQALLLDWLQEAMMYLAEKYGWEKEMFSRAAQQLRERHFENRFYLGSPLPSPDGRHIARLEVHHRVDFAQLDAVFFDNSQQLLYRITLGKLNPHRKFYNDFAFCHWPDNGHFAASNQKQDISLVASLRSKSSQLRLDNEKGRSRDRLEWEAQAYFYQSPP